MIDEDLMTRIKIVVDNLSYKIGDFVESIMDLIREHEQLLEKK